MPIVLEYQPSPYLLGLSGYLSGAEARRKETEKETLALLARQQMYQQQWQHEGYRQNAMDQRLGRGQEFRAQENRQREAMTNWQKIADFARNHPEAEIVVPPMPQVGAAAPVQNPFAEFRTAKQQVQERARSRLGLPPVDRTLPMAVPGQAEFVEAPVGTTLGPNGELIAPPHRPGRSRPLSATEIQSEMSFDREILEGLRRGQLELSPAAERQLTQIGDERLKVASDPALDDHHRRDHEMESAARYRAILRTARPTRKPVLTSEEEIKQKHRVLPGGAQLWRQPDGKDIQLREPKPADTSKPDALAQKITAADREHVRKVNLDRATLTRQYRGMTTTKTDAGGNKISSSKYNEDEIRSMVDRDLPLPGATGGQPGGPEQIAPLFPRPAEVQPPAAQQAPAPPETAWSPKEPTAPTAQQPADITNLPRPKTPEEAAKLHGTYFITPDGRKKWAP